MYAEGYGIGGIFKSLARFAIPLFKQWAKAVVKEHCRRGTGYDRRKNVSNDIKSCRKEEEMLFVKELKVKVGVGQRKREEMLQEFKSAKKQWHRKITPPVGKEMTTDEETDSGHYIWQNSLLGVLEQREDYWWASLLRERPKYVLMKAEQVVRLSQEDESSLKIIKTPNRYTLRRSY